MRDQGTAPDSQRAAALQAEIEHGANDFLPHTALSRRLDSAVRRLGDAISWIWLLLLAVIVGNVVLRYVFGEGRIEFEELQWHLYAVGFLVALSYCIESDDHIRVDVLRERLSPRTRAWVELYGIALLLLPFTTLTLHYAVPFVAHSFAIAEISSAPGGLPYRWAIKAMLIVGFAAVGVSALSRLSRVLSFLVSFPAPLSSGDTPGPQPREQR